MDGGRQLVRPVPSNPAPPSAAQAYEMADLRSDTGVLCSLLLARLRAAMEESVKEKVMVWGKDGSARSERGVGQGRQKRQQNRSRARPESQAGQRESS